MENYIKLDYDNLKELLKTDYMGRNIVYLEETGSTNDDAGNLIEKGAFEGTVIIAEDQTKGRGRLGREWKTFKGDSIAMSIILKPELKINQIPSVTPLLALASLHAIYDTTGALTEIKWPNDIILNGKKLAGILTEMRILKDRYSVIAGIGLNINQAVFPSDIENIATSLKNYLGHELDRRIILSSILNNFEPMYEEFKEKGISPFLDELKRYSAVLGKRVTVVRGGETLRGKAVDLDEEGALIVSFDNIGLEKIMSGEVKVDGLY